MRVTIDLCVVRALQNDLSAAGDQQGFLFGKEQAGATHINGREAVAVQGRAGIEAAIADPRAPVGYYRVRDGRAFILTSEEIEIANELFRRPGAVMLLIERRGETAAEATFFFRRGGAFVHNLPMPFPLDADRLGAGDTGKAPVRGWVTPKPKAISRESAAAIVAGSVLAAGIVAMAMWTPSGALEPPVSAPALSRPAPVEAAKPGSGLEFVWDPKSMPAATAGLLEVEDGGARRTIPLDADQLRAGSISYWPSSERVTVEMSTLQRDGRVLDNQVAVRGGGVANAAHVPAPPPIEAPAPEPVMEERGPAPIQAEPARRSAGESLEASSADRKVALKPFRLAAVRGVETASAVPVVLDPPAVEVAPVSGAVLPLAPVLRTHAPPPPVPAPTRFVASAGRLIWTGTLLRRGVVELDGKSASVGSISGALPGVPVNVTISPAEFEGDGLVVYTTDAARHQRVEPASASNGWNKVKWIWDPTRVHEISVLEPPNQSNGFNRLAFRNEARRTSIVWIDWRARQ